jgi:hypothetical protein
VRPLQGTGARGGELKQHGAGTLTSSLSRARVVAETQRLLSSHLPATHSEAKHCAAQQCFASETLRSTTAASGAKLTGACCACFACLWCCCSQLVAAHPPS